MIRLNIVGTGSWFVAVCLVLQGVQAEEGSIEEIVVTSKKRPMNAQEVPVAIQTLGADDIRGLRITDAEDILSIFANVSRNASNEINSGFTIRGVGTSNFHGNVSRAIGIYQDEVSFSTPFSGVIPVFDMDRIELLRGPQNSLFGRNTTGGAINFLTRKPVLEQGQNSYLDVGYGTYNAVELQGALNVSFHSNLAMRLSGFHETRDGLFTNKLDNSKLGEKDKVALRGQLVWQPSPSTEVNLFYSYAESDGTNKGVKANGIGDPTDPTQPCQDSIGDFTRRTDCAITGGSNPSNAAFHDIYLAVSPRQYVQLENGFLRLSHDFSSGVQLQSISALGKTEVEYSDDTGGAGVLVFNPFQNAHYDQFSQEVRLVSSNDARLKWLAGVFYLREKLKQATIVRRDANPAGPPGPGPNAEVISYNLLDQVDEDISLYAQLDYDLTEKTKVSLGARYTHNSKSAQSDFGVMVSPAALFDPTTFIDRQILDEMISRGAADPRIAVVPVPNFTLNPEQTHDEFTGHIEVSYQPNLDVMLYGRYARGFKSGGFDTRALAALNGDAGIPVGPEYLDAYEIGFKSDPVEDIRLNGAVFYYDWDDAQIFATVNGIPTFTNIPKSSLYGLDLEFIWAFAENWIVSSSVGLLESEVIDAGGLSGVTEGHDLSNAPNFSTNSKIARNFIVGGHEAVVSVNARYTSEQYEGVDASRDIGNLKPSVFELNARAEIDFSGDFPFSMAIWVNNLTGAKYCLEQRLLDVSSRGAVPGALTGTVHCTPSDGKTTLGINLRKQF